MIVNHKHRFLFVHIQKTAGTSITQALMKIEGSQRIGYDHSMIGSIDIEPYRDHFIFCFVRNPFDRLVSWWNMMLHVGHCNDFSRYLLSNATSFSTFLACRDVIYEENPIERSGAMRYPKSIAFNQLDYITDIDGRLAVNCIGRFENLEADFGRISERLGITLDLPHLKAYERRHYREYYGSADVSNVRDMYRRDLEYFGYDF